VEIVWTYDYYDSPLEGFAEWKGQKYWFSSIEEDLFQQNEFYLMRLPDSEILKIEEMRQLHASKDESFHQQYGRLLEKGPVLKGVALAAANAEATRLMNAFLDDVERRPKPDVTQGEVIG
jgi:hypothetical protein